MPMTLDEQTVPEAGAAPAPRREPLLHVDDITVRFGAVQALSDVSVDIHRGEIVAIIGPNGAGKTTLINVISGFYHPQQGRILFEGKDRTQLKPYDVAALGVARTFQNVALFKGMTVLDNIMTGRLLKMRGHFLLDAIHWGPARREELARALAAEPKLLLLDEPMAGMNVEEKEDMSRFILDVHDEFGTTIALIEHDMSVVMDISDRVVALDYGRKIADGTPDLVRRDQVVIDAYLGVAHV